MDAADPERLFGICDRDSKGYLVQSDLFAVCPQLSRNEVEFIFTSLDPSRSGRIEKREFCRGFLETASVMDEEYLYGTNSDDNAEEEYRSDNGHHSKNIPWINAPSEVFSNCSSSNNLKEDIPCQKDVLRFYKDLQTYGVPEMLYQFENVIGSLCKEIKEQKDQNETLQQVYHQEREMHNRRMNEVEHELDQQLSYAEEKARAEERQRLNKEKEDMRIRLEEEVDHLKSSIEKLQKVENLLNKERTNKKHEELEEKLQDLSVENRSLKSNLADNHLEITLIKAELAQVRSEYESKQADFFNEKENVFAAIQQKENLERQLELLYDANKKLHEANDTLTVALDHRSSVCQQFNIRAASPSNFSLSRQSSLLSFNDARLSANRRSNGCISSEDGHIQTAQDAPAEYEISLKSCSSDEFEQPEYIGGDGGNEEGLSEPTGPPERTFRVVLCGDASVGKSSIIMRIVKGVYASGLPSTLGVDFHVKSVRIGGKNVAVQLWDTAGQERFRSLCKSYFRRADGAVLVYDCSAENTFLRIREWVDVIKDSVSKPVPILMCANKTDLRNAVYKYDKSGANYAMNTQFIECSALEGTNIENALVKLTREMMSHEDSEMKATGVVLNKTSKSACFSRPSCSK
ncbi:hypothetical protein QR680_002223 [Steinernema hermaphroditum]|uniref:EF-hand domain-containing protein n=1 Tax=Steinernema hermaphroditum TaxID=289476 RepID=A0AA39LHB6_9BILA|nr:hypothetical protein QR680_002223 [Steinernema hermaphroditum]